MLCQKSGKKLKNLPVTCWRYFKVVCKQRDFTSNVWYDSLPTSDLIQGTNNQFRWSSYQTDTILVSRYWREAHLQLLGYSAGFSRVYIVSYERYLQVIKEICMLISFVIYHQQIHCLKYIFIFLCFWYNETILQNWGNYSDMSQGLAIYIVFAADVLLICWFGTQLTQHVRICGLYLCLTR